MRQYPRGDRRTVGQSPARDQRQSGVLRTDAAKWSAVVVIIVMGAAGAGKTTVGTALARALGWTFTDADTLHTPANIEKMRAGVPLTEADRAPWLARTREAIVELSRGHRNGVIACSALRERYRAILEEGIADVRWVFLDADAAL